MPQLASPRDEIFCQQVALGKNDAEAYRLAGGKGVHANKRAGDVRAKPGIQERIDELRAAALTNFELSRKQLQEFYVAVIRAKPQDASADNPLCEARMSKAGPYYAFPDKLAAAAALAKQMGWNEPEKVEVSGSVVGLLQKLTGAKK